MGKQFIERSPVIIGIITAALIVGALFVSLGVTREDLTGGYKLTMEFADANGLAAGDIAIVAGIQAGRVLEVDIVEDHVEAIVQMDGGVELRDEVSRLVDSGTDLTELVNSQEQQIRLLLRNLSTLSQTLESRDDELVGIIDDLDLALGNIAARRADLQDLLRETQTTGAVTADFLARVRGDLDAVLDELHLDLEIVRRHQVDLAEGLAYSGDALNGYASIGFAGDQPVDWGHVFVTSAGPVGVDVLVGCGGLIDQQLDAILGPDPRTCEEQGVTGTPGTQDPPPPEGEDSGALIPILPDLIGGGGAVIVRAPQELGIDVGPRSLMHMLEGASQ